MDHFKPLFSSLAHWRWKHLSSVLLSGIGSMNSRFHYPLYPSRQVWSKQGPGIVVGSLRWCQYSHFRLSSNPLGASRATRWFFLASRRKRLSFQLSPLILPRCSLSFLFSIRVDKVFYLLKDTFNLYLISSFRLLLELPFSVLLWPCILFLFMLLCLACYLLKD